MLLRPESSCNVLFQNRSDGQVCNLQGGRDYTAGDIRGALEKIGPVEDVVVRTSKKRKGSALAVMASVEGAQAALGSISGSLISPLLVVPYRAKVCPMLQLSAFIHYP